MQNRKHVAERPPFSLKLSESERDLADKLADHYGMHVSQMLRFLMNEKARELGYPIAVAPKPAERKKKRATRNSKAP